MFDKTEIRVTGGKGGDGVISFRREKFVPFGGPDGGDGGDGGNVVIRADRNMADLRLFKQKRFYKARGGGNGQGKKKHGKNGEDLIISVPVGTVVSNKSQTGEELVIVDLEESGQKELVARGGKGGLGNSQFVSSTNQAPRIAQEGEMGEENDIILELKLIADVGIIGYPNAGKSTLLTASSAAKPKIANYPFTTTEPVLGVVEVGQRIMVMAEIPGLIDGAHLGRGLGHEFLRHTGRTKLLIHLIDGSSASPAEDRIKVNSELSLFDFALAQKPQLVVINKIDLPEVRSRLDEIKDAFVGVGTTPFFISAATGEGVAELMAKTIELLDRVTAEVKASGTIPKKIFRPRPRGVKPGVHKEGDTFVVVAPELERIVGRTDIVSPDVLVIYLQRLGLIKALHRAGVKTGDKVRCGKIEWEWQ